MKKTSNARRRGRVYLHHGGWMIDFSYRGQRIRKRVEAETEKQAWEALDRARTERRESGNRPDLDSTRFEHLAAKLSSYYEAKGTRPRSVARINQSAAQLVAYFGARSTAREIPERLTGFVVARRRQDAQPATIRLELWVLTKMWKISGLGRLEVPEIEVRNVRTGFFESDELERVVSHLPEYLRPLVRFAALTGWRKSEVLSLRWSAVNFEQGSVRLEPGETKSGRGRTFTFDVVPELSELLRAQRDLTTAFAREHGMVVPTVFHHRGRPIRDLDDAWKSACRKAACPRRLLHDLRRTAGRNLRRLGLSESDIMELCGWETRSMFKRYQVTDERGLRERLRRAIESAPAQAIATTSAPERHQMPAAVLSRSSGE